MSYYSCDANSNDLKIEWEEQQREIQKLKHDLGLNNSVRDGERQVRKGSRQKEALIRYVEDKKSICSKKQKNELLNSTKMDLRELIRDAKRGLEEINEMQSSDQSERKRKRHKKGCRYHDSHRRKYRRSDLDEFENWLTNAVGLPQYLGLFVAEGFDNMESVQTLSEFDLHHIGITKRGHRNKIMVYVNALSL